MAEGGSFESGAFYDHYNCSDCLSRYGTYTEAVFYCPECNKHICKPCYVCGHDVLGRRNVDRWGQPSKRAQFDPCPKHKDVVCYPACCKSEHK